MTSTQYRAALAALGLTQAEAAELMGYDVRTSNGYANGWPIPKLVGLYLDLLLKTSLPVRAYHYRINKDIP